MREIQNRAHCNTRYLKNNLRLCNNSMFSFCDHEMAGTFESHQYQISPSGNELAWLAQEQEAELGMKQSPQHRWLFSFLLSATLTWANHILHPLFTLVPTPGGDTHGNKWTWSIDRIWRGRTEEPPSLALFNTLALCHNWVVELKWNEIKNLVLQLHWSPFKCWVDTGS